MSQTVITFAFEQWKAQEATNGHLVVLDEFVIAYVPGLDHTAPIDRAETLPPPEYIVHRQAVNKIGLVNDNAVVYSVTMGTELGDFDFNWIGLVNKATGTVAMIVHAPTQRKVATRDGQQGNVLTRSFLMEYNGAATETGITTPAETWQIDFTARLGGIDEMQRLVNRDHYGPGAFFGDAFLVGKAGSQYVVTAGTGYIGGLRAVMTGNQNITASTLPTKVWADVSYQGNVVSQWEAVVSITVAADNADYTGDSGFKHYVFAVASIDETGVITDLRPKGSLSDQATTEKIESINNALAEHEKSRNHPDGTLSEKGFVQLSSATDSDNQTLASTPKAVKAAMDNANTRIAKNDIAQAVGQRDDAVMSQKAVSDALATKQPKGDYARGDLFSASQTETYVFNPRKNLCFLITDMNTTGVYSVEFGLMWGFDGSGAMSAGTVPVGRITGLSQSVGASTTGIMSQKAVTDAVGQNASIGLYQVWVNMTQIRAPGVNYTNTTGRPICVVLNVKNTADGLWASEIVVSGFSFTAGVNTPGEHRTISVIVPPNAIYSINPLAASGYSILELRS